MLALMLYVIICVNVPLITVCASRPSDAILAEPRKCHCQ